MMGNAERRKHPRLEIELPLEITLIDVETRQPLEPTDKTTLSNISRGGLCARVALPAGDVLESILTRRLAVHVRVSLGEGKECVAATTRAAWCEKVADAENTFMMGLAFSEITDENLERLERFIAARLHRK